MKRYKVAIIAAALVATWSKSATWGVLAGFGLDAVLTAYGAPDELPSALAELGMTCGPLLARALED